MGTYWYWADVAAKEWIDPGDLGDNRKRPIDQAAVVAFDLMRAGHWTSVRVFGDTADLPWDEEPGWVNVTSRSRALLQGHRFTYAWDEASRVYRAVRESEP